MLCPHCTVHWVQCLNPSSFETVQLEACTWNLGPGGVWMYRNTLWFYTLNAWPGCHIQLLQNIWSQLNIRMLWGEWEEYDNHWESNPCQVAYLILASVGNWYQSEQSEVAIQYCQYNCTHPCASLHFHSDFPKLYLIHYLLTDRCATRKKSTLLILTVSHPWKHLSFLYLGCIQLPDIKLTGFSFTPSPS